MIDKLIAGKVYGQPQSRNDANGKPYAFGKVRAATKEGESLFVSVIVFREAVNSFMALSRVSSRNGENRTLNLAGHL